MKGIRFTNIQQHKQKKKEVVVMEEEEKHEQHRPFSRDSHCSQLEFIPIRTQEFMCTSAEVDL